MVSIGKLARITALSTLAIISGGKIHASEETDRLRQELNQVIRRMTREGCSKELKDEVDRIEREIKLLKERGNTPNTLPARTPKNQKPADKINKPDNESIVSPPAPKNQKSANNPKPAPKSNKNPLSPEHGLYAEVETDGLKIARHHGFLPVKSAKTSSGELLIPVVTSQKGIYFANDDLTPHAYSPQAPEHRILPFNHSGSTAWNSSTTIITSTDQNTVTQIAVSPEDFRNLNAEERVRAYTTPSDYLNERLAPTFTRKLCHGIAASKGKRSPEDIAISVTKSIIEDRKDPHFPCYRVGPDSTPFDTEQNIHVLAFTGSSFLINQRMICTANACFPTKIHEPDPTLKNSFKLDTQMFIRAMQDGYGEKFKYHTEMIDPSDKDFVKWLDAMCKEAQNDGGRVIIHYVGHGECFRKFDDGIEQGFHHLEGSQNFDFILKRFSGSDNDGRVSENWFKQVTDQLSKKYGVQINIIITSCFSGAAVTDTNEIKETTITPPFILDPASEQHRNHKLVFTSKV